MMPNKRFTALAAFFLPAPAFAYLDPGTGSMILQGVIAGIAIAWFTIKTYWYKFVSIFSKKSPEKSILDDDSSTE